jgi:hypothetical protein
MAFERPKSLKEGIQIVPGSLKAGYRGMNVRVYYTMFQIHIEWSY